MCLVPKPYCSSQPRFLEENYEALFFALESPDVGQPTSHLCLKKTEFLFALSGFGY